MKTLPVLDGRATGIDVGSESLHVSIGGEAPKVFGTMTQDLDALAAWLKAEEVRSAAVEATGVYWLCLYEALERAGIGVVVVNGRHVRNSRWGARPTWRTANGWRRCMRMGCCARASCRMPASGACRTTCGCARTTSRWAVSHVQHMQKALERMNIKFHAVISDLTGASGLRVVRAILDGERAPQKLLALCDVQIQKKKAERVRESLRGTWRQEHLFAARQALSGWEFYQAAHQECDPAIERILHALGGPPDALPPAFKPKPGGTDSPRIEGLHRMLVHRCGGADATRLPGMADYSPLQLIGEVGTDLRQWPTEKHFTAWTGLAPAARQSGKRRGREARHCNRAGQLFCTIARSLANSIDKGLGGFYRRLKARRGGLVANKALARKLAALFWQVMVHGVAYIEHGLKKYEQRIALTEQRVLRKLAIKHGFQRIPQSSQLGEVPG